MASSPSKQHYSQYGEDILLESIFRGRVGTCVEVGANDGVTFSNTRLFEDLGWQCILVEPTPALCEKIKATRHGPLFECAASDHEGVMKLQLMEGHDLYSSLETHPLMEAIRPESRLSVSHIEVPVRKLDNILAEVDPIEIDFLSIDVEGHELAVLRGFTLAKWRPKVIVIEDAVEFAPSAVNRLLVDAGYRICHRSGGNDWYLHPSLSRLTVLLAMLRSGAWTIKGFAKTFLPYRVKRLLVAMKNPRPRSR